MLRFDNEFELESNDLGRSLLRMIREEDSTLPCTDSYLSPRVSSNPFSALRERLSAVDLAIRGLRPQVQPHPFVFLNGITNDDSTLSRWHIHSQAC